MSKISQPEVTVNITPANVAVSNASQQVLFVGQKVAAGSAVSGALIQNILNDNAENALFGENSQLAGMIRDARKINQETQFDAISLDDNGSGVAATGNITVTGTATENGELVVVVGSEKNHKYSIAVSDTDTATTIGDAIEAAILADLKNPCTAANTAGDVLLTADNDGTLGNNIPLKVTGTIAGVSVALTAMNGGLTDPLLTGVLDAVGSKRYQTIVWAYADLTVVKDFLDARFNVNNQVQDGIAVTAQADTLANHLSVLGALNSQSIIYMCDEIATTATQVGAAQIEIGYSKAAQVSAVRSLRLTEDANISDLVITANGSLDGFGGAALASKPYFNTNMANLPLYDVALGFTALEAEQLHDAGGSVIGNNQADNGVVLGEIVTTYKTDIAGNPDISFKYANYVDTASGAREYFSNNLKKRFAQSRLTLGDVIRGRDMANKTVISGFLDGLYNTLSGTDFVLTQAGEQALVFFKDNKVVTVDLATGTVTIEMKTPIVTQLRNIFATMQLSFTAGA
jgi:phage tail sheath gpL-like